MGRCIYISSRRQYDHLKIGMQLSGCHLKHPCKYQNHTKFLCSVLTTSEDRKSENSNKNSVQGPGGLDNVTVVKGLVQFLSV